MIIRSLTATFGCLDNKTLDLEDGLNLICAPNEAGKSTWSAFIRAILYGLSTRERGTLADKNRFAPWNGKAMRGRLDCEADGAEITVIRDTVRANAPMGRFFASFAGTAEQVPWLSGADAGETLTGVPREVFERSAFIRQSGLAIDQDAELERRITALISSGEEDTSYSEAYKRLRDQLNRRRHNRTGILPQLDAEADSIRSDMDKLGELLAQSDAARATLPALEIRKYECSQKLALHDRMDVIDAKRALFSARDEAERAKAEADSRARELETDGIPSDEQLARLKFASANMVTTQVAVRHAGAQEQQAKAKAGAAKAELDKTAFSGLTASEARAKAAQDAGRFAAVRGKRRPPVWAALLAAAATVAALGAALTYSGAYLPGSNSFAFAGYPYIISVVPAVVVAAVLFAVRGASGKRAAAEAEKILAQYGVPDVSSIQSAAESYAAACAEYDALKSEDDRLCAELRVKNEALDSAADGIMAQVRLFSRADSMNEAVAAIEGAIARRRELSALRTAAEKKRLRYEALRESAPDEAPLTPEELALVRPAESRAELAETMSEAGAAMQNARSLLDTAAGRMSAIGDIPGLAARLDMVEEKREAAQAEYSAIAMAMEDLDGANAELQSRFSPALGKRAGEILARLTGNRYEKVMLDRTMSASAEEAGDPAFRSSLLLSQGAADQLYLAVRLAICDMVLPAEKRVPLVLDDALTNFDDLRMARALDYLTEAAGERQILLFSCQRREAEYLEKYENAHIITL
jgi:hypothetical protein